MKSTIEVPVLKYIHLSVVYLVVFLLTGWKESQPPQTTDLVNLDQSPQQVSGGVFIPRNGGFEGRIGQSQVFFNHHAGGVMSVVTGDWPKFQPVANLDMVFSVKAATSEKPIEVRQSFDKNPRILFLEEGNDRIGLRVRFKLFDSNQGLSWSRHD